jgi:sporulation protein YabP
LEDKQPESIHKLILTQRSSGIVTGVVDVQSFDETEILLTTCAGKLAIKGEKLHVRQLNLEKGEVEIEGRADSLQYMSKNVEKGGESLLKRMFR